MNSDERFETRLQRLPMKPLPPMWRKEILAAAHEASTAGNVAALRRFGLPWTVIGKILTNLFWPNPKTWAGLAGVWILILGLHLANREAGPRLARRESPPSPLVRELLQQQERLFAELVGPIEKGEATPPQKRIVPGPRTDRQIVPQEV